MAYMEKTILGIKSELEANTPVSANYLTNVTLNTKYGVYPTLLPTKAPVIKYIGIGINGSENVDGNNLTDARKPKMENLDLYQPIPFRCVPLANDLTAVERQLYRLRVVKKIGGIDYVLYYLRVMTVIDEFVQITRTDPVTKQQVPFTIDPSNLYPTPPDSSTDGIVGTDTGEINVTTSHMITITGSEVLEAINVLYGGDVRRAKVTEFGLYYGEDRTVKGTPVTGAQFDYTEVVLAHLGFHYCFNGMDFSNPSTVLTKNIRLGKGDVALLG